MCQLSDAKMVKFLNDDNTVKQDRKVHVSISKSTELSQLWIHYDT